MTGYLRQPDRTADVFRDGWYITGDIALLDDEGFLKITDRLSRFSKIGGEMVPHIRVEEALSTILGEAPCAVTGIPDEQRGERLVALYVDSGVSPAGSPAGFPRQACRNSGCQKPTTSTGRCIAAIGQQQTRFLALKMPAQILAGVTA